MAKRPAWFIIVSVLALLWNVAGLLAVIADLQLTPSDIAAMPAEQQALYAARPFWSVLASIVAVGGGTLGCIAILIRKRWATGLFYASVFGVIIQDVGIFLVAGAAKVGGIVPIILQSLVLVIAVALILLSRKATKNEWVA